MKQLHIRGGGIVVSTMPVFDDMTDEQILKLADDVRTAVHALRDYGPVSVWINEGKIAQLVGRIA